MEVPSQVLVHSAILGIKGGEATLLEIHPNGTYELNLSFGTKIHRVLLPVEATVLISKEPEEATAPGLPVEP